MTVGVLRQDTSQFVGGGRALTPHQASEVALRGLLSQVAFGRCFGWILVVPQGILSSQSIVAFTVRAVPSSRSAVEMVEDQVLVEPRDNRGESVTIDLPEISQFASSS